MADLAGLFNSSFLRFDKNKALVTTKGGGAGSGQRQGAAAPSRHFAPAPPAPKPAGMMPEFKPLFMPAQPPVTVLNGAAPAETPKMTPDDADPAVTVN